MSLRRERIVVIDDTEMLRRALSRQLEAFGFVTLTAGDGLEGLEAIREHKPDLVLCDLRMPKLDGLGLLALARREFPDLPIVVMSGAGLVDDAIGALKLGAWDYIAKPIEAGALKHAIDKVLERAALLEENRRYRRDLEILNRDLETLNRDLRRSLRLLADDEEAGRQIQFRLLPRNNLQFGQYRFTREVVPSSFLSGDFVDAFRIDDRHFAFYLADVAGHGVASALVTVLLRTFVQRQLSSYERTADTLILSPGRLLTRLNDDLARDDLEKHLTMFYGVVDLQENSLLYSTAGHFPWPILCDSESVRVLEHPGVPIGMLVGSRYEEYLVPLGAQVSLAVFSDGLLENLSQPTLQQKLDHLREYFGRLDVSIEDARRDLRFAEGPTIPDDIALLIIQRGGDDGQRARA